MNPQVDYEDCDTETTRAFLEMFKRVGDQFRFAIDSQVEDDEEVRAYLVKSNLEFDGKTTIGVTAINSPSRFNEVKNALVDMGLTVTTEESQEYHEDIGDYTAHTLDAYVEDAGSEDWNVPHLVVYGSLTPEIEEVCAGLFDRQDDVKYENIRNHYLVFGDGVDSETRTRLTSKLQSSNSFFESDKRHAVSSVRTADLV